MNARRISFTKTARGLLKWSPDLTALFGSKRSGMLMSKTAVLLPSAIDLLPCSERRMYLHWKCTLHWRRVVTQVWNAAGP